MGSNPNWDSDVFHCLCAEHFFIIICRVVSRFLSRRFNPKSMRLFPFYFSNITLRTDLLTFGVTGAVFKIAGEMRRLLAYFDNPASAVCFKPKLVHLGEEVAPNK